MQLIFLNTLKEISGYADKRSIETWLAKMNISLMRIGKNHAVEKESFERAFEKKYKIKKQQNEYRPEQEMEKKFLSDLTSEL